MESHGANIADLDRLCFVPVLPSEYTKETVVKAYSEWIRKTGNHIDSVIDPFSPDFLAEACEENGLKVPEDISIIRIARSSKCESKFNIPTLENNLLKHFHYALSTLEERFKTGKKAPGAWIFCPPGNFLV